MLLDHGSGECLQCPWKQQYFREAEEKRPSVPAATANIDYRTVSMVQVSAADLRWEILSGEGNDQMYVPFGLWMSIANIDRSNFHLQFEPDSQLKDLLAEYQLS